MINKDTAAYYAKLKLEKLSTLSNDIKLAYLRAFRQVLTTTYMSGVAPTYFEFRRYLTLEEKVDSILDNMARELYDIIEQCAIEESRLAQKKNDDNRDIDIIAFVNRSYDNKDINLRLAEYGKNAKLEFEAFIAAGLLLRKPITAVINDFKRHFRAPYSSAIINDVYALDKPQIASKRLLSRGVSYGRGKYVATINSLLRLSEYTANASFEYSDLYAMRNRGATGYIVSRGSYYPCDACDSVVGYHPISVMVLPVHPRCMCYAVPVR